MCYVFLLFFISFLKKLNINIWIKFLNFNFSFYLFPVTSSALTYIYFSKLPWQNV